MNIDLKLLLSDKVVLIKKRVKFDDICGRILLDKLCLQDCNLAWENSGLL